VREWKPPARELSLQQMQGLRVIDVVPARNIDARNIDLGCTLHREAMDVRCAPGNVGKHLGVRPGQSDQGIAAVKRWA